MQLIKSGKMEPLSDDAKDHEAQLRILQDLIESLGREKEKNLTEANEREQKLVADAEKAREEVVAKSKLLDETEAKVDDVTEKLVKHMRECKIAQLYKTNKPADPSVAQTTLAQSTPHKDRED